MARRLAQRGSEGRYRDSRVVTELDDAGKVRFGRHIGTAASGEQAAVACEGRSEKDGVRRTGETNQLHIWLRRLLRRAGVTEEAEGPDHHRVVAQWRVGAVFTSPPVTVIPVFQPRLQWTYN